MVDGVSLDLDRGEMLAVVGESGSGKSVLARSIMRLLPKQNVESVGSVRLDGEELVGKREKQMRAYWGPRVAMIFQDPMTALNPVVTVGAQIMEPLRVHTARSREQRKRAALGLLREVGVSEPERRLEQYPHQLSGGMRQRVMIAIALAVDPELLMADEPTTALDVTIQQQVLALIKREQSRRNMSVVFITHDLSLARTYAERVAVMYAGQLVEVAPIALLQDRARSPYTVALQRSSPRLEDPPHRRLEAIPGRPPSLLTVPEGCRFAPRCVFARERCLTEPPPLVADEGNPDHLYRCFFPVGTALGDEALASNRERGVSASGAVVEAEAMAS